MNQRARLPSKMVPFVDEKATTRPPRRKLAWLVGLVVICSLGVWWWTRPRVQQPAPGPRNAAAISISEGTATKGDIGINLDALGTVASLATVTVVPQISGQITRIAFTEGQEVRKGDLLAEINSRPYEAALAQAQGNLTRDQALLKGAQVDLTRYQGLAEKNAVPRQTLDTQVALVAQDQGIVEADRAAVKAAEVNLVYCRILAPVDGRAGLRQVDQGNYVTPANTTGIVVITQLRPISVLFTLPEDRLQAVAKRLKDGAKLPATAFDRSGSTQIATGMLQTFDSQIDPTTGTIKLRAQFSNDALTLFPNQFVNIRLLVDTRKDAILMPTAGVQRGVPGTFVYLLNADNTVSIRKITLGVTEGDHVEVLSGLAPGDRMVIDGADKLRNGAKVDIRPEADKAAAAAPARAPAAAPAAPAAPPASGGSPPRSAP